ncbi:MAG: hypothetical protein K2N73_03465 [Lachnospiraceae bacterium]|nr:hypothetical protein [Lachnospiraceae bacterium]
MMQLEFERLCGQRVSDNDYCKIEKVYMMAEKITKKDISDLWCTYPHLVTGALYDASVELDTVKEKLIHKENELRLTRRVLGRHNTEYNTLLDSTGEIIAKYDECKTELQQYKTLVADIREYVKGYEILNVFNRMIDNYGL